jgi:hypothetical protein
MANQIAVTQLVANKMLAEFANNNSLLFTGQRTYEGDYTQSEYKYGDTIQIRRQSQVLVYDGRVGVLQPDIQTTEPITINHQLHVEREYSSRELTLFVDTNEGPFYERTVRPAVQAIAKQAENIIAAAAETDLYFTSGNPSAPFNTFAAVDLVYAKMQEQAIEVDNDGYMALSPRVASALKASNQNAFNPILNEDISFSSRLGHYSVFDTFSNQSIRYHTVGVGAVGATVATTVTSGSTSVALTGLGASVTGVYLPGDIIRFDSVNSVNPVDRSDTGQLMDFVVKNQVDSDAGGLGTVVIGPAIISDPASPYRNVSTPVVAGMPVTLEGTPSQRYRLNLAYAQRGLDIVAPPMEMLDSVTTSVVTDKDLNISMRVGRQASIMNDTNIIRIDMLLGVKWHPQYCMRVHSL